MMTALKNRVFILGWMLLIITSFTVGCTSLLEIIGWNESDSGGKKAQQFLSTARQFRGNPYSHYLLDCYYQERGRHREAIEEFKKALVIDPYFVKAYNGLGVSYDLSGEFSKAMESYQMALSINPNLDYVYNNLGYSCFLQGMVDEAIINFKKAIDLNNRNQRYHNNLALAFGEKGEYALAFEEFKLANDEAKAHYYMAQIYFKKNRFEAAKDHYAKALKLNPSLTMAQTSLDASIALAKIFGQTTPKESLKPFILPESSLTVVEKTDPEKSETPLINGSKLVVPETFSKEESGILSQDNSENKELISVALWKNWSALRSDIIANTLSLNGAGIEISNGNGVNRMAKRVGEYLKEKGFKVSRLTNADHFRYSGTKIIYQKEYDQAAEEVAQHIPTYQLKEEIEKLDRPNIKVKILIGKDLIPYLNRFENGKKS